MAVAIRGTNLTGASGTAGPINFSGDGPVTMAASGDFGGGTLTMEWSPDGGTTWIPVSTTLSADGEVNRNLPAGEVRASLSGASAADIDVWILHAAGRYAGK